jgi:hypothetical protein
LVSSNLTRILNLFHNKLSTGKGASKHLPPTGTTPTLAIRWADRNFHLLRKTSTASWGLADSTSNSTNRRESQDTNHQENSFQVSSSSLLYPEQRLCSPTRDWQGPRSHLSNTMVCEKCITRHLRCLLNSNTIPITRDSRNTHNIPKVIPR